MDSGESINGVRPSLGLAWADMVTMRLMLTREEGVESCEDIAQKVSKVIAMIFTEGQYIAMAVLN